MISVRPEGKRILLHSLSGFKMAQTWSAIYALEQLLTANKDITRILDLGTGEGGLTIFWGLQMAARNGSVLSFDIKKWMHPSWFELAKKLPIKFMQRDVFDQSTIQLAADFIKKGRTLVFCDASNKPKSLNIYSRLLKKNDLIMAHDWGVEIKPEHLDAETLSILKYNRHEEFTQLKTRILSMRRV